MLGILEYKLQIITHYFTINGSVIIIHIAPTIFIAVHYFLVLNNKLNNSISAEYYNVKHLLICTFVMDFEIPPDLSKTSRVISFFIKITCKNTLALVLLEFAIILLLHYC